LNLPQKSVAKATPTPATNPFGNAYANTKRRAQPQSRYSTGVLFRDYLSAQPQATAQRTSPRTANRTTKASGFNMNLLSKPSANAATLKDYGVTLGGWSPVGGSPAAVQKTAPKPKSDPDLMAVDKRTAQQLAKAVRTEQAAARNAGSLLDSAHSNRARAKEDTLDDAEYGIDDAQNTKAVKMDMLGEDAFSKVRGEQKRQDLRELQQEQAVRTRKGSDNKSKSDTTHAGAGSSAGRDAATQISMGAAGTGRSTGYNDRQDLATALSKSGQHGNVGVSDLTSYGTIRGSQQTQMLGADPTFAPDAFENGSSGGGDSSRVICTELVRQGWMAPSLQRLDVAYTLRHLSPATVRGYHAWAVPYVRLMKRSHLATRLVEPLARWRAEEIAFRMKSRSRLHYRGRVVRWLGEPVCWVLGTVLGWVGDPDRFQPWTEPQK